MTKNYLSATFLSKKDFNHKFQENVFPERWNKDNLMKRKYLNFCRMRLFFLVYVGFMFIFNVKVWAGTLIPISSAVYDGGFNDYASGVTRDGNNNIIVTGRSHNGLNDDYFTIKYDSNLVVITSATYNGGSDYRAQGVSIDSNNNIIVAGFRYNGVNSDYFTIKYDSNLAVISSAIYDGGSNDYASGMSIDGSNNIVVAGHSNNANDDYFIIKYDSDLVVICSATYDGGNDESVHGVSIDATNNIVVTGHSNNGANDDYFTIKYDSNLVVISSVAFDGGNDDYAHEVVITANNNIIVTGYSNNGANDDYFTIKYDSDLVVISSATYDGGSTDAAQGVSIDGTNNIVVTGQSNNGANNDYFTIKYNSNLVVISSVTYDGGDVDSAYELLVDGNNNIIVSGSSFNGTDDDYFTIKYLGPPQILSLSPSFASSGETLDIVVSGLNFYNGADIVFSETGITINSIDFISATQLRVNVTLNDNVFSGTRDITVTNIDEVNGMLAGGFEIRENIGYQEEEESYFVKLSPKIITPNGDGINDVANFIFTNPNNEIVEGIIFDLSGSVVRDNLPLSSTTSLTWDGRDNSGCVVSGKVYIYQIKVGSKVFNGTVVVAK